MTLSYYYIMCSLPMLKKGEAPLISSEYFFSSCTQVLPGRTVEKLSRIRLVPENEHVFGHFSAVHRWYERETNLRNRLARFRAVALNRESKVAEENHWEIDKGIEDTLAVPNPLERERMLDALRWKFLDDLEFRHNFNFDALCVYRIKLMILEKWVGKGTQKGLENLEAAVNNLEKSELAVSR